MILENIKFSEKVFSRSFEVIKVKNRFSRRIILITFYILQENVLNSKNFFGHVFGQTRRKRAVVGPLRIAQHPKYLCSDFIVQLLMFLVFTFIFFHRKSQFLEKI